MRTAAEIARAALDYFGSACTDVAYEQPWEEKWNKEARSWYRKAKADGCQDFAGAYTDVLYNDPDVALDFIGDFLADECGKDKELYAACVKALKGSMPWMPESFFEELQH